jgi:hypothetical protein
MSDLEKSKQPAAELPEGELENMAGGLAASVGGDREGIVRTQLQHNFSSLLGAKAGLSSSTHGSAQKKEPNLCDCDAD